MDIYCQKWILVFASFSVCGLIKSLSKEPEIFSSERALYSSIRYAYIRDVVPISEWPRRFDIMYRSMFWESRNATWECRRLWKWNPFRVMPNDFKSERRTLLTPLEVGMSWATFSNTISRLFTLSAFRLSKNCLLTRMVLFELSVLVGLNPPPST